MLILCEIYLTPFQPVSGKCIKNVNSFLWIWNSCITILWFYDKRNKWKKRKSKISISPVSEKSFSFL